MVEFEHKNLVALYAPSVDKPKLEMMVSVLDLRIV